MNEHHMQGVLIVEDDKNINDLLATALRKEGYRITQAWSGTEGAMWMERAKGEIGIVLLDLMLPGMSGEELLRRIRQIKPELPVIVLTAKDALDDKMELFSAGADDYITKPFEIKEVIARVAVQLRHAKKQEDSDELAYGELILDRKSRCFSVAGKTVDGITRQEFSILELLMEHPRQVFAKEDIFEYAWEEPYYGETKTLDVHISNIRKKIKRYTPVDYIETVWGIGYKLHEE